VNPHKNALHSVSSQDLALNLVSGLSQIVVYSKNNFVNGIFLLFKASFVVLRLRSSRKETGN
jgi:hypothetical protein